MLILVFRWETNYEGHISTLGWIVCYKQLVHSKKTNTSGLTNGNLQCTHSPGYIFILSQVFLLCIVKYFHALFVEERGKRAADIAAFIVPIVESFNFA